MSGKAFDRVMQGLGEALAHAKGDPAPGLVLHLPETVDVASIRRKSGLSQTAFAGKIGVPVATLRNWEQKRRSPGGTRACVARHAQPRSEDRREDARRGGLAFQSPSRQRIGRAVFKRALEGAWLGAKMAGHSQFKNIMHKKGKQDAIRSKLFSKLAREITVAARMGLPDPAMNARLRAAVIDARAENMPKDNIERAIKKASGADGENYDEVRYEGYAPGGVAIIVEALTDNRNRTAGEVRSNFTKAGGALAETGAVSFMFDRVGSSFSTRPWRPTMRCSRRRSRPAPKTSSRGRTATK